MPSSLHHDQFVQLMLDTLGPTAIAQRPWLAQSGKAQVDRMLQAYLDLRDEFIANYNEPLHSTLDSIKNKAARLAALAMVLADTAQERLSKDITGNSKVETPVAAPPKQTEPSVKSFVESPPEVPPPGPPPPPSQPPIAGAR